MRILFLNPIGRIGGGERMLLDVLAELRAQRPDIERRLVLLEDGPLAAAARELAVHVSVLPTGASLASIGDSGLRSTRGGAGKLGRVASLAALAARGMLAAPALWRVVRELRREIRAVAPDVVHSNGIKTHLLAALATPRNLPLVWHVHDFISSR